MVIAAGKSGFVVALDRAERQAAVEALRRHPQRPRPRPVYALKHEYSKLKTPETVYPGLLGGVIAPMATNGSTVFVPVVNHSVTIASQGETQETGRSPANWSRSTRRRER